MNSYEHLLGFGKLGVWGLLMFDAGIALIVYKI